MAQLLSCLRRSDSRRHGSIVSYQLAVSQHQSAAQYHHGHLLLLYTVRPERGRRRTSKRIVQQTAHTISRGSVSANRFVGERQIITRHDQSSHHVIARLSSSFSQLPNTTNQHTSTAWHGISQTAFCLRSSHRTILAQYDTTGRAR